MKNFNRIFDQIDTTLSAETVLKGENGTGYFNGLTLVDFDGDLAKFTDRHDRRGIVCKTRLGNIVFFQRRIDGERFAYNAAGALRLIMSAAVPENVLTDDSLSIWIGNFKPTNTMKKIIDEILNREQDRLEDEESANDTAGMA
jgi:hypothetical protein